MGKGIVEISSEYTEIGPKGYPVYKKWPKDTVILGVEPDDESGNVHFHVEHPDIPEGDKATLMYNVDDWGNYISLGFWLYSERGLPKLMEEDNGPSDV
jgi:hypothetical protein